MVLLSAQEAFVAAMVSLIERDTAPLSYSRQFAHSRLLPREAQITTLEYAASMDLTYPAEAESFRKEIRTWLEENLPEGWFEPGLFHESRGAPAVQ